MDAALWLLEEQMLSWANVWNGLIAVAHPVSLRIPIVAPFAAQLFGGATGWAPVAVAIFNAVFIIGPDGHDGYEQQYNYG